ncbi:MAG: hypothetical protein WBM81_12920, partial [Sedimenticolaceae bacterium]
MSAISAAINRAFTSAITEELDVGVMFGAETGFSGERVSPLVDAATGRAGLAWFVTSLLALERIRLDRDPAASCAPVTTALGVARICFQRANRHHKQEESTMTTAIIFHEVQDGAVRWSNGLV